MFYNLKAVFSFFLKFIFQSVLSGWVVVLLFFFAEVKAAPGSASVMMLTTRFNPADDERQLFVVMVYDQYRQLWRLPGGDLKHDGEYHVNVVAREIMEELKICYGFPDLTNLNRTITYDGHTVYLMGDETCRGVFFWDGVCSVDPTYSFPLKFTAEEIESKIILEQDLNPLGPENKIYHEVIKVTLVPVRRLCGWLHENPLQKQEAEPLSKSVIIEGLSVISGFNVESRLLWILSQASMIESSGITSLAMLDTIADPARRCLLDRLMAKSFILTYEAISHAPVLDFDCTTGHAPRSLEVTCHESHEKEVSESSCIPLTIMEEELRDYVEKYGEKDKKKVSKKTRKSRRKVTFASAVRETYCDDRDILAQNELDEVLELFAAKKYDEVQEFLFIQYVTDLTTWADEKKRKVSYECLVEFLKSKIRVEDVDQFDSIVREAENRVNVQVSSSANIMNKSGQESTLKYISSLDGKIERAATSKDGFADEAEVARLVSEREEAQLSLLAQKQRTVTGWSASQQLPPYVTPRLHILKKLLEDGEVEDALSLIETARNMDTVKKMITMLARCGYPPIFTTAAVQRLQYLRKIAECQPDH
ncbi:hypothetical protein [Spongorhabdus nitratireducens]